MAPPPGPDHPSLSLSWTVYLVLTVIVSDTPSTGHWSHCCHLIDHLGSLSDGREIPRPSIEAVVSYQNFPLYLCLIRKHTPSLEFIVSNHKKRQGRKLSNQRKFHKLFIKYHSSRVNSACDGITNGTKVFLGSHTFLFTSLGSHYLWLY